MNRKIAAIGDKDSVMGFSALGIDIRPADEPAVAERALFQLAQDGYAVIFVTEQLAEGMEEIIGRYAREAYPAIIPIPSNRGGTGLGMQQLKRNVEKALGADILFGNEG